MDYLISYLVLLLILVLSLYSIQNPFKVIFTSTLVAFYLLPIHAMRRKNVLEVERYVLPIIIYWFLWIFYV